ncbi:hypothetical protein F5B20DRAFT_568867 [Whalleya microplaca]|nr:hypothetical protein F5B20DRAFT_568867 [Whalleya microplaca]
MSSEETCANPLLLGWVQEWVDEAQHRNSKGLTTYKNAYKNLKACPIKFTHPSQLQQLAGFGPTLCARLTAQMQNHCRENGLPMPRRTRLPRDSGLADLNNQDDDGETRPARRRRNNTYVPKLRSGGYAIIVALSSLDEDSRGMTKDQLIEEAQPHCDSSFTAPTDPTKFYTAWSSVRTLIDKDLVHEKGRPKRRYTLTDEGWEVARRFQQAGNPGQSRQVSPPRMDPRPQEPEASTSRRVYRSPSPEVESKHKEELGYANVVANGDSSTESSALPNFRPIRLAPGSFSVQLVLDVREVRAKKDRDYMQDELTKKGIKPIMRSLELGDALWVAKCHDANFLPRLGSEGDEVVLDWVVERKRLDDLISSIRDGRFHEQKFRLRRSGVKNVIYLVEEISMDKTNYQNNEEAVHSAIASTQVVNGYFLKKTQSMDDTIRYLTRMTMMLKKQYESKSLLVIPTEVITAKNYLPLLEHLQQKEPSTGHYISYPAFASMASKSDMMTLGDLYLKMLMCTKQVTGEKALEIQKRWKTPYDFVKAFEACGPGEDGKKRKREMVSSQMENLVGRKKITKALGHKIAEVWADI